MFTNPATEAAVISGILSFIFGGGLIAYLKFRKETTSENRSFAEAEREKMKAEIEMLRQAVTATAARLIPSNFPTWIKDEEGKYIDVNPAWELQVGSRIGLYKKDVIGKSDAEVFKDHREFAQLMADIDSEASQMGGIAIRKGVTFPKDGTTKIVIKEIVVQDVLGKLIFKGMGIPDK